MKYYTIIIANQIPQIFAFDDLKAAGEYYHSQLSYAYNQNITTTVMVVDEDGITVAGKREKFLRIPPVCTVTYHSEHGAQPSPQQVTEGEHVPFVPNPGEDPDYDFFGWYADAACETIFDFTQPIMASVDVYAKWVEKPEPEPEEEPIPEEEPKVEE